MFIPSDIIIREREMRSAIYSAAQQTIGVLRRQSRTDISNIDVAREVPRCTWTPVQLRMSARVAVSRRDILQVHTDRGAAPGLCLLDQLNELLRAATSSCLRGVSFLSDPPRHIARRALDVGTSSR